MIVTMPRNEITMPAICRGLARSRALAVTRAQALAGGHPPRPGSRQNRSGPSRSRIASRHRCEIWVAKEGEEINGKSIMGLMMLAAGQGSKLRVRAEGPDAVQAIHDIEELIQSRFNEE